MSEVSFTDVVPAAIQTRDSDDHRVTTSPPSQRIPLRSSSIDAFEGKVDYHQRHIDHLKELSEQKANKLQQLEQERIKLEIARERLARKVLRRAAFQEEPLVHQSVVKEESDEADEETKEVQEESDEAQETDEAKKIRSGFRSRYKQHLKHLAETNKLKQQKEEHQRQRRAMTAQKLKEDLGLLNVNSKLHDPTVASIVGSSAVDDELLEKKGVRVPLGHSPKHRGRRREEAKEEAKVDDKVRSKKAGEEIVKRAQGHLAHLADKKAADQRKEEEERERRAKQAAQAKKQTKLMKPTAAPESLIQTQELTSVIAQETPIKKKSNERVMERLVKVPRRIDMPVITDIAVFRKKNKLSDKDKIFIIAGGYPDIRKALARRGKT
jgi:hypothetical protein